MNLWNENIGTDEDVVVKTRIRLIRNLNEFPFPAKMDSSDRHKLIKKVMAAVTDQNSAVSQDFLFVNMEEATKTEAVSLVERHITSPEFISDCDGRGVVLWNDKSTSMLLNSDNHIQIQVLTKGLNLAQAYQKADQLDTILDKSLHFAFDEKLGFLTQNPVYLGTGMRASLILHLPALMDGGGLLRIASNLSKLGLSLRGIYGAGEEPRGALYQLSNQVSLGLSEQEALANLNSIALQIVSQERAARQSLAEKIDVQDTVCRSLGILLNARVMPNDEFMRLISNVRFGISTGLIAYTDYDEIDRLIIEVQPATLTLTGGKKLTANERRILRAKKINSVLNNITNKAADKNGSTQQS